MKKSLVLLTVLLTIGFVSVTYGQPNAADPDLRFWLAADSLAGTLNSGDPVNSYTSLDSYATIMAPDLTGTSPEGIRDGIPGNEVIDAAPIYEVWPSGHSVLRFDAEGSSFAPGGRMRLWQMNNLAALGQFDPVDIGDGTPLTIFGVYRNTATTGWLGGTNPIVAKRGTSSCVWEFGDQCSSTTIGNAHMIDVIYDAITVYPSGDPLTHGEEDWNLNTMTRDATPTTPELTFFLNNDVENSAAMTPGANNGILIVASQNASTPEAMGIGCHGQDCCGHGESFAGYVAEIIIYAKDLEPGDAEYDATIDYLAAKYAGIPEPMTLSLLGLGGLALLRRKRS
jgi:hypothetical protein